MYAAQVMTAVTSEKSQRSIPWPANVRYESTSASRFAF